MLYTILELLVIAIGKLILNVLKAYPFLNINIVKCTIYSLFLKSCFSFLFCLQEPLVLH